jgi:uncharacterized SAM-binding protein YcdF (DUF218 family)
MLLAWKIAWRVALGIFVVIFIYLSVTFFQVWRSARKDAARSSDAIVVLGAAQYDGRPSPVLQARLDHALQLYEDGVAPMIVVTGGRREGDRFTEATASASYLHAHGVPDTSILRETTGKSSWESLAAAGQFLEDRGMTRVVLVSDPYHAARIDDIAEEVGLDAVTSPTRTSPISGGDEWRRFGTETLRVAAGRLFGYGRLERGRAIGTGAGGTVVPGLGMLIPPSGVV